MKKIRMKCIQKTPNKLALVKLIKQVSDLGLKDSKNIVDTFDYDINMSVEFEILNNKSIEIFRNELKEIGGQYSVNGGVEFDRELKLLKLGLGQEKDYVDFISENLSYTNNEDIIKFILGKLNKEDLIQIINKLNI
jgi:hypothetical protein